MERLEQFRAVLAQYRKHGWQAARVLMTPGALDALRASAEAGHDDAAQFEGLTPQESEVDAVWFRRASPGGREAWELRLVAEPYALFEMFESDEAEEDREDARRELEAMMREKISGRGGAARDAGDE